MSRIGKTRRKRREDGTFVTLPPLTHGICYPTIWNEVPYFHVMRQGMLIPCAAHDVLAGIARRELSAIFLDIGKSKYVTWSFLQINLKKLKSMLVYGDKRNISSKLSGILDFYF